MSETCSLSPLSVLTTHEASLPWSQVSFLIIYLGTNVHVRYPAAYEIANVFPKKAALSLPPFHAFTGCDKVFAYTFFYTIEKVVLYRQLKKPKVVSFTRPSLFKHFKGTANHTGHIWSQQALIPSISVPSLQDWGWISLRGEWRLSCWGWN